MGDPKWNMQEKMRELGGRKYKLNFIFFGQHKFYSKLTLHPYSLSV